ncbi:hypothetical protein RhiirA4_490921, partial [Rhizophagus irregularis]
MHEKYGESFILVAISRINVDEDMKGIKEKKHDNKTSEHEPGVENTEIDVITHDSDDKTTDQIKKGFAVYRVEVEKKMNKCPSNENLDDIKDSEDQNKEGIAINRIEIENEVSAVTCYYSNKISGICKFIEVSSEYDSPYDSQLKRFIILNFHGIYNLKFNDQYDQYDSFELNEEFEYPKSFKHELENFYTRDYTDIRDSHDYVDDDSYDFGGCMKRLLS